MYTHTHIPENTVTHSYSMHGTSNLYTGHVAKLSLSGPTPLSLSQPQSTDLGFK